MEGSEVLEVSSRPILEDLILIRSSGVRGQEISMISSTRCMEVGQSAIPEGGLLNLNPSLRGGEAKCAACKMPV